MHRILITIIYPICFFCYNDMTIKFVLTEVGTLTRQPNLYVNTRFLNSE